MGGGGGGGGGLRQESTEKQVSPFSPQTEETSAFDRCALLVSSSRYYRGAKAVRSLSPEIICYLCSHGVTFENRFPSCRTSAGRELTELLINPSKVLQTNGNAVMSVPPAQAPEGHAAERPIHPRGGTGNEETAGVEASKACYALARSECVCMHVCL